MGKVRVAVLGDEEQEKKQRKRAEKRREAKKAKKDTSAVDTSEETKDSDKTTDSSSSKKAPIKNRGRSRGHGRSKRYQEVRKLIDRKKQYALTDAVSLVKQSSPSSFDGTVELHVNLKRPMLKGKGDFRSSVVLPHSTGKDIKVAIANDEVIAQIDDGNITFDVLVAAPSMMPKLAKHARTLGPRGLMPNPKNGTVTDKPEERAKELAAGEINFKTEPGQPILHLRVGKVSQEDKILKENIEAYFGAIGLEKIEKATISSTMGPGVKVALE